MNQDTRKDPRAKVLTMTVRYKSATLDEFIEHHSYDVSRGGMFIKTPSPFPPGTLLKFEVKIADEQRLMQGVGRVVWKREANDSNDSRPAGMGVKFIKIDDESRRTIERLVDARGGDGDNAFDQGNAPRVPVASAPAATVPSAIPSSTAPTKPLEQPPAAAGRSRKATVIGLGAMKPSGTSSSRAVNVSSGPPRAVTPSPPQAQEKPAETFFPKTDSRADMPPVEDQTMMKQAKELLADAMRYAGGTAEDVKAAAKVSSIPPHVPRPEPHKSVPPRPSAKEVPKTRPPFAEPSEEGEAATTIWRANEAAALLAESMKDSEPPPGQEIHGRITARPPAEAAEPEPRFRDSEPATTPGTSSSEEQRSSAGKVAAAAPAAVEPTAKLEPEHVEAEAPASEPPKPSVKATTAKAAVAAGDRPSSRARASQAMAEAANESSSEGGGGKGVFALLALAAAAGIGFYLTRPPSAAPEPPPEPAPVEVA
ncbi:MAG: TIGR02266 family protein, partial [Myxococcota bacterium]|nr:TIGR02266 family protein [Myxococcota bacterium]